MGVGGLDSGPGPYDLLLAGLGACTSMTMRMYAERKALPLDRVTVKLKHSRIYAKDSISDDLIAAARVDGAGDLRIFFTICLRIMSPALITVFLFSFVGIWNNFFLPMVTLTDNSLWPVTLGLYFLNSQPSQMNYNLVITGALLSTIPLQVFAASVAQARGYDVDKPRNLAKSVTVE